VNIKNLAKISSKPGKTRLINHYLVNDTWYLVDLPGYGYARTGKTNRDAILKIVTDYLANRSTLSCLFILIDSRHKPLENDVQFINSTGLAGVPLALVFTKSDKLGKIALKRNLDAYRNTLKESWEELPPVFVTSSEMRTGREELLDFIESANKKYAGLPVK
jgi:GTP-binding protein